MTSPHRSKHYTPATIHPKMRPIMGALSRVHVGVQRPITALTTGVDTPTLDLPLPRDYSSFVH